MFRRTAGLVALVVVFGAGVAWAAPRGVSGEQARRPPDRTADEAAGRDAYARLPLTFVPNAGQSDERVRYSTQGSGYGFFFTPTEVALAFTGAHDGGQAGASGHSLALTFLGSDPDVVVDGRARKAGTVNYVLGGDPSRWHMGLPTFGEVTYGELWPGVEMEFRGDTRALKYELRVAPGADVDAVRLAYRGAEALALGEGGSLRITTAQGVLTDSAPLTYQAIDGRRVPVHSRFVLHGGDRFGFETGSYDDRYPLIVDPGLAYSTFLGGALGESADDLTLDAAGNAYLTGLTASTDFPTTPGAYDTSFNGAALTLDAFVTKLDAAGSGLVYSTYLGGAATDFGREVVPDGSGNAYVTGRTESGDFPTTAGAYDTSFNGVQDAFVTKLSPAGSALVYSTYLGSGALDDSTDLVLDGTGAAYVTGETDAADFPTTAGAYDTTFNSTPPTGDAFVTKLDAAGSALAYSTFLGGADEDGGSGIALDGTGAAYTAGSTRSLDFPTTAGSFDTTANGNSDLFVTKLNDAGSALGYSTYLGGTDDDGGSGVALDGTGAAYVAGGTLSADFPTTAGAYATTFGGAVDATVTKLDAAGSSLAYSTYLGGSGTDASRDLAVDQAGRAHVTGQTVSTDYPTTAGAYDTTFNGGPAFGDAFVTKLDAAGSGLAYSTFLGGADDDEGFGIAVDATGKIYVAGSTRSANYPTTASAYDTTFNGVQDAFVTKLDPSPAADTVALSPPAAVNPVGSSHTVTATATAGGQPVPGLTILFTVQGATNASGSCTTDASGQCTFTYQGPNLPGADLIMGCADNNANATADSGEPCGQATKAWVVPAATPGQATGGGQIFNLTATDLIAFGFTARSDNGVIKGQCTLVDPSTNTKIKCTDATVLAIVGNTATFFGNATVNGTPTSYRIDATDNGEPGAGQDTFAIQTASGYTASGTLQHGNIQIRS